MPNYIKLIESVYSSIFNKKSNNHPAVVSRNLDYRKNYIQSILASKDLKTESYPYLAPSSYRQINRDFQLAVPHSRFLPQHELEQAFKDFCIQLLTDMSTHIDMKRSTLLSALHHNNAGKCRWCCNYIDKKYLFTIRANMFYPTERLCLFCLYGNFRYYKCEKCGAYATTDKTYNPLKFYPEISVILSDNEKETYSGVSVSLLQKLGITGSIKPYKNKRLKNAPNLKYLLLYPTPQSLDMPEVADAINNKRILSALKKYWGHTLCDKCQNMIGHAGDNLIISGLYPGLYVGRNLPVSYPVEYVDYIDVDSIQKEVRDMLIAEVESNPELIYPLLMQPKEASSLKDILKTIVNTIITKFASDKDSDSIVKEITANRKSGEAIIIIPQEILIENDTEKIQDTLDRIINNIYQKVDCNVNSGVSLEDDALTITLDISK